MLTLAQPKGRGIDTRRWRTQTGAYRHWRYTWQRCTSIRRRGRRGRGEKGRGRKKRENVEYTAVKPKELKKIKNIFEPMGRPSLKDMLAPPRCFARPEIHFPGTTRPSSSGKSKNQAIILYWTGLLAQLLRFSMMHERDSKE